MNKFLKKVFYFETTGQIIEEFQRNECSLGDPFQKLFAKFCSVIKHGISERGLLALYGHKEILVNSSLKATKKTIGYALSSQKFR